MQIRVNMPKLFGKTKLPALGKVKKSKFQPGKLYKTGFAKAVKLASKSNKDIKFR